MSTDTIGLLKGRVAPEELLNFIKQRYDNESESYIKKENDGTYIGRISFLANNENRSIFYISESCSSEYEEIKQGTYTYISLNYNDNSVNIIREIVTEFGGYIDENDCDDRGFEPIIKNADGTIKPIIRVTMDEVHEKFGGIVIIEK